MYITSVVTDVGGPCPGNGATAGYDTMLHMLIISRILCWQQECRAPAAVDCDGRLPYADRVMCYMCCVGLRHVLLSSIILSIYGYLPKLKARALVAQSQKPLSLL